ncbi:MAG: hypothetical protein MJZ82_02540 [Paludibacteraceae bacterium]|nr:hypothetical protein [Paludibacteraceae bacterium]
MESKQQNIISDAALQEMTYRELSVLEGDAQKLIERVREQKQKMSVVEIQRLKEKIQESLEQIEELGGNRKEVIEHMMSAVTSVPEEVHSMETTTKQLPALEEEETIEDTNPSRIGRTGLPLMKDLVAGIGLDQLIQMGNDSVTEKNENPQWGRIYSTDGLCPTLMHTGKTKVVRRNNGTEPPNKVKIVCVGKGI